MRKVAISRMFMTLLAALLLYVGMEFHAPLFFKPRPLLPPAAFILGSLAAFWHWRKVRFDSRRGPWVDRLLCLVLLTIAFLPTLQEKRGIAMKREVLSADPGLLQKLGKHIIVGYTDFEELKLLVSHGAIGGIFVTDRNIRGKSARELRSEIDSLQEIQSALGLAPLWVATDQEGGIVSKLSPLARPLPSLGDLVTKSTPLDENLLAQVGAYARMQAEDLSRLGVNLNFSPVVDLKPHHRLSLTDRHTRIDLRAIASDPQTVAEVALEYCRDLSAGGVMPTLKHFPGLASVDVDTHLSLGSPAHSLTELKEQDWQPFQRILASTDAFLMLGHVRVPEVDETYPASLSRKLIQKVLRREWGFDGVLITDDFSMGAIYGGPGGVESAAPRALNAGVDLILIAYDGDLYYPVMKSLLAAHSRGELAQGFLDQSESRLARKTIGMNPRASLEPKSAASRREINPSEHSEREGEAPWALPMEGATRAPVIENSRKGEAHESAVDGPLDDALVTGRERQDAYRKSLLRQPEKRALGSGLGPSGQGT